MAPPTDQSTTRAISGGFVPPTVRRAGEELEETGEEGEGGREGSMQNSRCAFDAYAMRVRNIYIYQDIYPSMKPVSRVTFRFPPSPPLFLSIFFS